MLGIVQGATELLPISSSGHLILVPWAADWTYLETHESFNKTFDVALHLGTLDRGRRLLLVGHRPLRRRAGRLDAAAEHRDPGRADRLGGRRRRRSRRRSPGALGESFIEKKLGEPWQIAITLAVFGVLLWLVDRLPEERDLDDVGVKNGFLIGVAQVLALIPGVSRSGITITAGTALEARPGRGGADVVPAARPGRARRGASSRASSTCSSSSLPAGSGGPFLVGTLAALGGRARGDPGPARLRPAAQLHDLRGLPGRPRGRSS